MSDFLAAITGFRAGFDLLKTAVEARDHAKAKEVLASWPRSG